MSQVRFSTVSTFNIWNGAIPTWEQRASSTGSSESTASTSRLVPVISTRTSKVGCSLILNPNLLVGSCQALPPIDVDEGTPCHTRTQLAFNILTGRLQPLEKWKYDKISTDLKVKQRQAKKTQRRGLKITPSLPEEDDESGVTPPPAPDPTEPKVGSVLALCASIAASQAMGDLSSDTETDDDSPAKQLFKKLKDGLISAGERETTANSISIVDSKLVLHLPSETVQLDNIEQVWAKASELVKKAAVISWFLRVLYTCVKLGRRKLLQDVTDANVSEEKKKTRWMHGILMLNRMVNKLGQKGLRLYDAAAGELDKLCCFSVQD